MHVSSVDVSLNTHAHFLTLLTLYSGWISELDEVMLLWAESLESCSISSRRGDSGTPPATRGPPTHWEREKGRKKYRIMRLFWIFAWAEARERRVRFNLFITQLRSEETATQHRQLSCISIHSAVIILPPASVKCVFGSTFHLKTGCNENILRSRAHRVDTHRPHQLTQISRASSEAVWRKSWPWSDLQPVRLLI